MSKLNRKLIISSLAIAVLGIELAASAPTDFRIIPAGDFRSWDGRPFECSAWVCTEEDGRRIVAELAARQSPRVIDYEHATIKSKTTGAKAPAAGWFSAAEWRDDGVWLVGVDWTALAAQEISDTAYRFISPVFSYDKTTGRVGSLLHASLTNDPAVDGLTDLAALAANFLLDQPSEEKPMDELLEQLRWLLNMPLGATAEDVVAQLKKLQAQLQGDNTAAATFDLSAHLAGQALKIVDLSSQIEAPDPARFVPIAMLSALQAEHVGLQQQLATLSAEVDGAKLEKLVVDALAAGKLTPATEAWARDLGKKDFAALSALIEVAPVVVKLGSTQTGGGSADSQVDANDGAVIAQAALSYQHEQAAKGFTISTVAAVAHVTNQGG